MQRVAHALAPADCSAHVGPSALHTLWPIVGERPRRCISRVAYRRAPFNEAARTPLDSSGAGEIEFNAEGGRAREMTRFE